MNKEAQKTGEQPSKIVRSARAIIRNLPFEGFIALSDVDEIITPIAGNITNIRTFRTLRQEALRYANQHLSATQNQRILNVSESKKVIYHRTTAEEAARIEERMRHNKTKAREQRGRTFPDVTESYTLGEINLKLQKPSIWSGQFDKFEHSLNQDEEVTIEIS